MMFDIVLTPKLFKPRTVHTAHFVKINEVYFAAVASLTGQENK